ncbi:MAG: FmdB family zinc ribbon protein [Pontimonas sp.]
MPTYSYRCRECGVEFDIQQDFSDDALTECPQCKGSLRKLFSAVGVTFQGSGFYRTDSRADSSKKEAPKKDSGKKESKPKKKDAKKASSPS